MQKFQGALSRFIRDDEAATAAEYGLIAALIAAAILAAVSTLGGNLRNMFQILGNKVSNATPT